MELFKQDEDKFFEQVSMIPPRTKEELGSKFSYELFKEILTQKNDEAACKIIELGFSPYKENFLEIFKISLQNGCLKSSEALLKNLDPYSKSRYEEELGKQKRYISTHLYLGQEAFVDYVENQRYSILEDLPLNSLDENKETDFGKSYFIAELEDALIREDAEEYKSLLRLCITHYKEKFIDEYWDVFKPVFPSVPVFDYELELGFPKVPEFDSDPEAETPDPNSITLDLATLLSYQKEKEQERH